MKLLIVSAFLFACAPMSVAQAPHTNPTHGTQTAHVKPKQDVLPQTTLDFKPVGDGLPVSAKDVFLGYPFCDADGTLYLNALVPRNGGGLRQAIAISPKGEVSRYGLTSVAGLVDLSPPMAMDANASDVYVLVTAVKGDVLLDHDVKPHSAEVRQYAKYFILRFKGEMSAPDEIPLDLPFQPERFAVLSEDKFVVLGLEQANQTPVLAIVDGSGQLDRYIDAYQDFGTDESIVANAPQWQKSGSANSPDSAALETALTAAQFVHYRDSLLLLLPGANAKVFTIRSGGAIQSTTLQLPAGLQAESLIPSENDWFVRAEDMGAKSWTLSLVMVDPSTGKALRILHSPQLDAQVITCVHDGDYYGVHWAGKDGSKKIFLMKAAQ